MGLTFLGEAREEGKLLGERRLLLLQLEHRFGPLSPLVLQRFEVLSPDRVREIALALLKAQSLQELGLADDHPAD